MCQDLSRRVVHGFTASLFPNRIPKGKPARDSNMKVVHRFTASLFPGRIPKGKSAEFKYHHYPWERTQTKFCTHINLSLCSQLLYGSTSSKIIN